METKSPSLSIDKVDKGRAFDWGKTSADYARYRPGPPASFYEHLVVLGVGLPGQRLLDLGTGTGFLATNLAHRGSKVVGIDIATAQLDEAKRLAQEAGLNIDYRTASAEKTGLPDKSFDAITANQCWLYFDHERALAEVRRLLVPHGLLVVSHFSWLPRESEIARRGEELILKFNPDWTGADWPGTVPPVLPTFIDRRFMQMAMFQYDEDIPFTRESWRGRIRACRGVGAALGAAEVEAFDSEHDALLAQIAGPEFAVKHRIFAHIMSPI